MCRCQVYLSEGFSVLASLPKRMKKFHKILKNDHSPTMENYFIFSKFLECCGKCDGLIGSAQFLQIFDILSMADRMPCLSYDRAFVEISRRKVSRCSDSFHSSFIRLIIGFRTLEGGKKCMMDIDDRILRGFDEFTREDFHITCQSYDI